MSFNYHNKAYDRNNRSSTKFKRAAPKKVLQSKKLGHVENGKSCSTGIINDDWHYNKPKKVTKSDVSFSTRATKKKSIDYCKKCGDQVPSNGHSSNSEKAASQKSTRSSKEAASKTHKVVNSNNRNRAEGVKNKLNGNDKVNGVKQYYKNENFQSTDSLQDAEVEFRKMSLDTIKEVPEVYATSGSAINIYEVYTDSDEEVGFLDTNDSENIISLKKFRDENYFECHSVKSRVEGKGSASSLIDHKCVYRFYLNDRLFPVPISTDHHNNVRCVECHLPINLKQDNDLDSLSNGTIQAKVKLSDNETQDMILMLPVKDSLIIKEKRKQMKTEDEVLYFGVIKLDTYGNSVFKSTLPADSLALKYQKGYHEHGSNQEYAYSGVEKDDIIVI